MPRTQSNREIALATPLDPDLLLLTRVAGREELGRLFEYELEMDSDDAAVNFEDLIGQNVTVRIESPGGETRYINGYISCFVQTGFEPGAATYEATVVPWLWFLTRTSDCRIFQNMTVPDIVKQVIRDRGFSDVEDALEGTYPEREYCVQYAETDFNFISRLMEHEGIYYYFKHANGKHTLVLADAPTAHAAAEGAAEIRFHLKSEGELAGEYISEWTLEKSAQPGRYSVNDFDFVNPGGALESKNAASRAHAAASFEMYDYPGGFTTTGEGERYARVRLEELQSGYEWIEGVGDERSLAVGHTFKLVDHPRPDQNREYLVVSTEITVVSDDYGTGQAEGDDGDDEDEEEEGFTCDFEVIPAKQPFRPDRTTPRPRIRGPQTAIVVGKAGEEIWTEEHGRVKVQFHWDRNCPADENSSCWVRVAQSVAGKKWGGVFLPRIGQEVIVEFLEGDPDRPIITGRLYNGTNKPPYDLPANATQSGLKSSSSKGGEGFNEIRFEDKAGEEQVVIHAQKDMHSLIENDATCTVVRDSTVLVKRDFKGQVDRDSNEKIGRDHVEEVGKDRSLKVAGKEMKEVAGKLSLKVDDDVAEQFGKNHHHDVAEELYIKARTIVIEATENLTLKVKQTTIAMEQDGFALATQGTVKMESMGETEVKATGALKLEGAASAEVKGTGGLKLNTPAIAELKGSMVNIN